MKHRLGIFLFFHARVAALFQTLDLKSIEVKRYFNTNLKSRKIVFEPIITDIASDTNYLFIYVRVYR